MIRRLPVHGDADPLLLAPLLFSWCRKGALLLVAGNDIAFPVGAGRNAFKERKLVIQLRKICFGIGCRDVLVDFLSGIESAFWIFSGFDLKQIAHFEHSLFVYDLC